MTKREIEITCKLDLDTYVRFSYLFMFRKPTYSIIFFAALLAFFSSFLYFFGVNLRFGFLPYIQLFVSFITLYVMLVSVYIQAKKTFNFSKRIREKITYCFSDQEIKVTGESFSSNYSWEKLLKIEIRKNWVLVYHSNTMANIIHRSAFQADDFSIFVSILKSKNLLK